jgi:hypothetical protein
MMGRNGNVLPEWSWFYSMEGAYGAEATPMQETGVDGATRLLDVLQGTGNGDQQRGPATGRKPVTGRAINEKMPVYQTLPEPVAHPVCVMPHSSQDKF